jgi:hypothetical protein
VDDCQFEWEAAVMSHLVEYIRLFQKPNNSTATKMSTQDLTTLAESNDKLFPNKKEGKNGILKCFLILLLNWSFF